MKVYSKKQIINFFGIILLIVFIMCFTYINVENNDAYKINVSTNSTIEKKHEWGIKRNSEHKQPDVGSENKKILEEYNGICLGCEDKKYIYLTFDEGYEAGYTEKILDTLKENNVKAAFFITAHYVNTQEELVKRMIDEGHIVGNHTVNHKSMPTLTEEEIKNEVMTLHQGIYEKFGYEMKYLRAPKGEFSIKTLNVTNSLGYRNVMWSFAYEDWNEEKQPNETKAKEKIINNLHNGEIMLLHGNSKTNTNILGDIIKEARSMGYEFKSLDEFQ